MAPAGKMASATALPLWAKAVGVCLALLLVISWIPGLHLRLPFTLGGDSAQPSQKKRRPSEFLYLDNERAAAYLAQLEGGVENSKRLTNTLTTSASVNANAGDVLSFGGSSQVESFVEQQVTPTAAAIFFQLLDDLKAEDQISEISIGNLRGIEDEGEGALVSFETDDLRTPVYVNPYLVVRQSGTLPALFPVASEEEAEVETVEQVRTEAKGFAHEVGRNPRLVFAIQGGAAGSQPDFSILMPLHYRQMTDERSLIQNGGGRFTVVGKVVRLFDADEQAPYVDSPTREAWTQPLKLAPEALIQRASKKCEEEGRLVRPGLRRKCDLDALHEQTQIAGSGAVIIPVAIYK
jgi:hypothetical protein